MGEVIVFPVTSTLYPDSAADLETAECVLLLAIRWWVESHREGDDPIPRLCEGLEMAGTPDAAFPIDGLMTTVAQGLTRPIDIRCPRCPLVSQDEKNLLRAAALAQAQESKLAAKVLRNTLLSAHGADFAVGPLEGLGELFAQARLFLSRPQRSNEDLRIGDGREPWSPSHPLIEPA